MSNIQRDFSITFNTKKQPYIPKNRLNEFKKFLLQGGDIVITLTDLSQSGKFLGVVGMLRQDEVALLNQRVAKFVINDLNKILPEYFYLRLQAPDFRQYMISDTTGSLQKNTNNNYVLSFKLHIPPLPTQKKIASKIDTLFAKIDRGTQSLEKAKRLLEKYRQSVLKHAFEGKLTAKWREENGAGGLNNIQWKKTSLKQVTDCIQYGFTASSTKLNTGVKILRITDIQNDKVNWNQVPYCKIDKSEISKYQLNSGDIVFARTGATVGKSFLIKSFMPNTIFASYLIRVVPNNLIESKFLAYFFRSPQYWSQISKQKAGIGQPNVNGTKLSKLIFYYPPKKSQREIVDKIDTLFAKVDSGARLIERTQKLLEQCRQSILKSAFEGKLIHD